MITLERRFYSPAHLIKRPLPPRIRVSYNRRMTICIGALAAGGKSIVCVADKGLSYGDQIQWDSDSTKIVPIAATGLHALIAGGETMLSRVLKGLESKVSTLDDLPSLISQAEEVYQTAESQVLEAAFLRPYLLSVADYNRAATKGKINKFIRRLTNEMAQEQREPTYTSSALLLCGFDKNKNAFILSLGAPGLASDLTNTGNGAIGSGYGRAISRLLWSGWERSHSTDRVLFDTFDAKADAEMVPTVGGDWDAVIITAAGPTKIEKPIKDLIERAWVKVTRSPWEKHEPVTDIPEPPDDWKEQLEKYCNAALRLSVT